MFLVAMMVAMVVEAGLCLPRPARPAAAPSPVPPLRRSRIPRRSLTS